MQHSSAMQSSQKGLFNLVPVYRDGNIQKDILQPDSDVVNICLGHIVAYTEVLLPPSAAVPSNPVPHASLPQPTPTNTVPAKSLPISDPYASKWASIDLSDPASLSQFLPLETQPDPEARNLCDNGVLFTSLDRLDGGWNGWPSGKFALDLTHQEYQDTKNLQVHWATRNIGGDRKGSRHSSTIADGKISHKICLGVMHCDNSECQIITRPFVKSDAERKRQLEASCSCGAELQYFPCGSQSYLIIWGQIGDNELTAKYRYINGDAHVHSRIPNVKHLGRDEEKQLQALVHSHPNLEPAALMVGPKTLDGYGPGAANIGPAGHNPAFIAYQHCQIKGSAQSGHSFLHQFCAWQQANPSLV